MLIGTTVFDSFAEPCSRYYKLQWQKLRYLFPGVPALCKIADLVMKSVLNKIGWINKIVPSAGAYNFFRKVDEIKYYGIMRTSTDVSPLSAAVVSPPLL
jgi:hypothetical protein